MFATGAVGEVNLMDVGTMTMHTSSIIHYRLKVYSYR